MTGKIGSMRLYRRHGRKCRFFETPEAFSKTACSCPIYFDSGERGKNSRQSIGTRDWARAQARLIKLVEAADNGKVSIKVPDACTAFLADCRRRNLRKSTLVSYRNTLAHFERFASMTGLLLIAETNPGVLLAFQNAREVSATDEGKQAKSLEPSTARKELQTLRAFFRFLVDQGHVAENYAKKLRPPRETRRPTLPFTQSEVEALIEAARQLENDNPSLSSATKYRAEAVLMTMLYSGLRISDVAVLERGRVNLRDGRLLLRMEKTSEPVYVRLATPAVKALSRLHAQGPFFFWSGESAPATAIGNMRRTVDRICKKAGVQGHPHRFRDTFAVRMLEKGVPIDHVSILLGHTSVKTTEKYYAPWVRSRQKLLDEAVSTLDFVAPTSENTRLTRVK